MKYAIDIDENVFTRLFDNGTEDYEISNYDLHTIATAIRNGTPLPKGHGALKDADELAIAIAMIRDKCNYYGNEYEQALFQAYDNCVDEIIDAPTIIEADKEMFFLQRIKRNT